MLQNVVDGHIVVERILEALVQSRQCNLDEKVQNEHDLDVKLQSAIYLLGVVRTATLKLSHTAAFAKEMVYFADFVQHGPVNNTLKFTFICFSQLFTMLVDCIAHFLAIFDEFIGVGLVLAIFHYLLYHKASNIIKNYFRLTCARHDSSHEGEAVGGGFGFKHEDEAILNEKVQIDFPMLEINEDGDHEDHLHE